MLDLLIAAIVAVFVVVSLGLLRLCQSLLEK
jgi:hypothetical protein